MLITATVGMLLASPVIPWSVLVIANLGIALSAGCAATMNHLVDRHLDQKMQRTQYRPVATGRIGVRSALLFAALLGGAGLSVLFFWVNPLTALLTLGALMGYALLYTVYLKRATPQNIVIGGVAGAAPPVLGWVSVTGHVAAQSLLLMLIIFVWTPPHFWALAIHRAKDYAKADVPMLPITHGVSFTKLHIFLYTLLLIAATLMPFVIGMSGWMYLAVAMLCNAAFLYWVVRLCVAGEPYVYWKTFKWSIYYLFGIFMGLLLDHFLGGASLAL